MFSPRHTDVSADRCHYHSRPACGCTPTCSRVAVSVLTSTPLASCAIRQSTSAYNACGGGSRSTHVLHPHSAVLPCPHGSRPVYTPLTRSIRACTLVRVAYIAHDPFDGPGGTSAQLQSFAQDWSDATQWRCSVGEPTRSSACT